MQAVYAGDEITFDVTFTDSNGAAIDPDDSEVNFRVLKNAVRFVYGPYTYTAGDIERVSDGVYRITITLNAGLIRGFYTGSFYATVEGTVQTHNEQFQVLEEVESASGILDAPRIYGHMRDSAQYNQMGMGQTDSLFLIGHADGLELNSPYQVVNIQEAVNLMGADTDSPLLRGMFEAYNAGARDIWLVAAAPMSEYVPLDNETTADIRFEPLDEWGGLNFYEKYAQRLETTYALLKYWDPIELQVVLEAPFYNSGSTDFIKPLITNVIQRFELSGAPSIALMGSRLITFDADTLTAMQEQLTSEDPMGTWAFNALEDHLVLEDSSLAEFLRDNQAGKYCMLIFGEGSISIPQFSKTYVGSVVATAAGVLASLRMDQGLVYKRLPNVISPVGKDLTKDEVNALANNRINPLIKLQKGKRGEPYQTVLATDNLMSPDGSDFWAISQMRLVIKVAQRVRSLGQRNLGTIGFSRFKQQVNDYLNTLTLRNQMRGYDVYIYREADVDQTVKVELLLRPYGSIREIFFTVEVGPSV